MPAFASGDIEHEQQHPAARDVPEKIVPEPDVAMGAFDQAWNVCDRSAAITVEFNDADDRMKGSEWVRSDLRMRGGNFPQQRRFARVRITDQGRVRHRAQFQKEMSLLSLLAFRVLDRRAVLRALEVNIAFAATA